MVGPARVIAFGTSIVAPAGSAVTLLILVIAYWVRLPLVILICLAGSLCCAISIGQFAGRVPSAGWVYTYNSRGLGRRRGS